MTSPPTNILADEHDFRLASRRLNALLAAVALLLAVSSFLQTGEMPRTVMPVGIVLLAGLSELVARRDPRRALMLLCLGIWVIGCLSMWLVAGVRSAFVIAYPFLIALSGWVMGRRWLLGLTGLSSVHLAALGGAEWLGFFHPAPPPTPLMLTMTTILIIGVTTFLTATVYQAFQRINARLLEMTDLMLTHNAELAVRENDMEFVVNAMPVRVAIIDSQWRVLIVNRSMQRVWGGDGAGLRGASVDDLVRRNGDAAAPDAWERAKRGEQVEYLSEIKRPDGTTMYHQVALIPKLIDGRVDIVILVAQDITELYRVNREVHQLNETLEQRVEERTRELAAATESLARAHEDLVHSEAKATLGTMVAGITHEMGTPIGNSLVTTGTLREQVEAFARSVAAGQLRRSELDQTLQTLTRGVELLTRNLERAHTLLQSYKQGAADQFSEQRREFDLKATVDEIITLLRPTLKKAPHRLRIDIPPGIVFDSYPGPLGQVFINLINNAWLHAFEGKAPGELAISAQVHAPGRVRLVFADNGVGMSDAVKTKLFEPFFSTKLGRGGTGLGMSIVEGIVRKTLGGSLEVDSSPGNGTRYTITLPLRAEGS